VEAVIVVIMSTVVKKKIHISFPQRKI